MIGRIGGHPDRPDDMAVHRDRDTIPHQDEVTRGRGRLKGQGVRVAERRALPLLRELWRARPEGPSGRLSSAWRFSLSNVERRIQARFRIYFIAHLLLYN